MHVLHANAAVATRNWTTYRCQQCPTEAAISRTLILPFLRFRQSRSILALPVLATFLTAQEVIEFSGTSIVATDARTGSIRRAAFKRLANRRT